MENMESMSYPFTHKSYALCVLINAAVSLYNGLKVFIGI